MYLCQRNCSDKYFKDIYREHYIKEQKFSMFDMLLQSKVLKKCFSHNDRPYMYVEHKRGSDELLYRNLMKKNEILSLDSSTFIFSLFLGL